MVWDHEVPGSNPGAPTMLVADTFAADRRTVVPTAPELAWPLPDAAPSP